ncbi:MobA/MobL family protein, partial [Psychrobacter sp. DAB_AL32B]|uniref:MobA/MobL family protein n=1 Tax=Psychrobacter sp. DAB_AL32B TaxID=1028414 RepID=UPI000B9D24B9
MCEKACSELYDSKHKASVLNLSTTEIKKELIDNVNTVNTKLEKLGIYVPIDDRTLKQQGIEQIPTIKIGWKAS